MQTVDARHIRAVEFELVHSLALHLRLRSADALIDWAAMNELRALLSDWLAERSIWRAASMVAFIPAMDSRASVRLSRPA